MGYPGLVRVILDAIDDRVDLLPDGDRALVIGARNSLRHLRDRMRGVYVGSETEAELAPENQARAETRAVTLDAIRYLDKKLRV